MDSVVFSGCRGQLHRPANGRFRHLVLICGAFGAEALYAQRAFCALGEDLAHAGLAALRFDYPGQGDSGELAPEADVVAAWLDSVRAALDWARTHYPGVALSLCGHRLGALLAAQLAATEPDVGALLLLSPPASGRQLLREWQLGADTTPDGSALVLQGWRLPTASLPALQALALDGLLQRPGLPLLALCDAGARALHKLARTQAGQGGSGWEVHDAPDLAGLRAEPHLLELPEAGFAAAVQWLARLPAAAQGRWQAGAPARPLVDVLTLDEGQESSCRFGPGQAFFGLLCRPEGGGLERPCVLILNTGGNPRSGHHRLGVTLARALARQGVASLRIDATGIGDALPAPRGRSLALYSQASLSDVGHALDWLAAQGWPRALVFGICSGAYLGLHAARHEPRLAGLALVNPQSFLWQGPAFGSEAQAGGEVPREVEIKHLDHYWQVLFTARFWRRLGRGEIAVQGVLRQTGRTVLARVGAAIQAWLPRRWALVPRVAQVQSLFEKLRRRQVPVLLVYSDTDPGLNELQTCFGAGGRRLLARGGVELQLVAGADHTFTAPEQVQNLIQIIRNYALKLPR